MASVPIDPGMVERLAAATGALYEDAEQRLLGIVARALAAGIDSPTWAAQKLAAVQPLRRAAQAIVGDLADGVPDAVRTAVADAYGTGERAAADELGLLGRRARALVDEHTPQAQAVDRLAAETVDIVTATHRGILRGVEDGYRQVVSEVSATPLLGIDTRRQATQEAMSRFAARGITSFTDRSGRRWQLTSYAEMAVRTSVARAATEAHAQTLTAAGVDLVIVSDSPRECPLCRPWEGKVLALSGPDGPHDVQAEHGTEDDRIVTVHVAGTLDEARRAGLQHPNCRHSLSAYLPGVTRPIHATADPDGYAAGQRQRAIERHIRRWKREAAAAVTPEGKRAANARVRGWQGAMRQHLADNPDLRRLPHREQPGASNLPTARPPIADVHAQAARVRAGDPDTLREMTDDQLGAAVRSRTLDRRDLTRIAEETDRRYPPQPLTPPSTAGTPAARAAEDGRALDTALSPLPPLGDWARWGAATATAVATVTAAAGDTGQQPTTPPASAPEQDAGRVDIVQAVEAGAVARRHGDPPTVCPYPPDSTLRAAWMRGYTAGG